MFGGYMNVRTRPWAAGALAICTAGALVSLASPAYAASGVDLTVKVDSSKIAIGAPAKIFFAKITNLGDVTAEGLTVDIDLAGLDSSRVEATVGEPIAEACDASAEDKITCTFGGTLAADETFEFPLTLTPVAGAEPGSAGEFTVAVQPGEGQEDADTANNTTEVPVELVGSGGDIVVLAQDVIAGVGENGKVLPVPPGETAPLFWLLANSGDTAVRGLTLTVELPEHVTFAEKFEGCVYSNGDRSVTCTAPDEILEPDTAIGPEEGWAVEVSADAPGPVNLAGTAKGSASAVVEDGAQILSAPAKSATPEWCEEPADMPPAAEVDEADNSDDFTVFIGAPAGGGGGGLPVTGVQVGLIGGIGGGVLAVGAVLFLLARRRRVVLVTPGDETPTV
jgi:hypothetical protein